MKIGDSVYEIFVLKFTKFKIKQRYMLKQRGMLPNLLLLQGYHKEINKVKIMAKERWKGSGVYEPRKQRAIIDVINDVSFFGTKDKSLV